MKKKPMLGRYVDTSNMSKEKKKRIIRLLNLKDNVSSNKKDNTEKRKRNNDR